MRDWVRACKCKCAFCTMLYCRILHCHISDTFAIIGWGLYGSVDPEHFGSLFRALFTLFRLLTLDDWFEIYEYIKSQGTALYYNYLLFPVLAKLGEQNVNFHCLSSFEKRDKQTS